MYNQKRKPLYGKIFIKGLMICKTGLHIGAAGNNLEIGGLDSPVVRDPISRAPYVPGSSLKGKMRSLLERKLNKIFNKESGNNIYRHECNNNECPVCRLFGSTGDKEENIVKNIPGRLIIRDMMIKDESKEILSEIETGLLYTEWKFENSLDRITAEASPRQLERVPRDTKFDFEILYNIEIQKYEEIKEDLKYIIQLLRLIEDDVLGGNGSRGYGQVEFNSIVSEVRFLDFYCGKKDAIYKKEIECIEDCDQIANSITSYFSSEG